MYLTVYLAMNFFAIFVLAFASMFSATPVRRETGCTLSLTHSNSEQSIVLALVHIGKRERFRLQNAADFTLL